jgi:hypothetical protein
MVAFINVYESLAQAFSSLGVASGMLMYMFLVDQGNTFNGVFSPIPKTEYPFKFLCAITPARQMVTSLTYLQYVGPCTPRPCATWFQSPAYPPLSYACAWASASLSLVCDLVCDLG